MTARKRKLMTTHHLPMPAEDLANLVASWPTLYDRPEVHAAQDRLEVWAHGTHPPAETQLIEIGGDDLPAPPFAPIPRGESSADED